jgi:hypothetical protein
MTAADSPSAISVFRLSSSKVDGHPCFIIQEGIFAQARRIDGGPLYDREGNTVSVILRQARDGSRIAVLRRKEPIDVEGAHLSIILETGMERDEDGVVLGSTGLSGSQRLHR